MLWWLYEDKRRGVMAQLSNNKLTGRAGADGHNGAMTWPYSASALQIARCKQVALWGLSALLTESAAAVHSPERDQVESFVMKSTTVN